MNLLLIRHGVTDWNQQKIVQGRTDHPLNETGIKQIEFLQPYLQRFHPDRIYASPVKRAHESAQLISEFFDLQVVEEAAYSEFLVPEWVGKTVGELNNSSESWHAYKHDPLSLETEDGETILSLLARVATAFDQLDFQDEKKDIMIVSHAEVIKVLVCYLTGLPLGHLQSVLISPGSATLFCLKKGRWRLDTLNYGSHLFSK